MTHSDRAAAKGRFSLKESSFLDSAFVAQLRNEARKYGYLSKLKTRKQWFFAKVVCDEWSRIDEWEAVRNDPDVKEEISKYDHYSECSYWINAALPFPLVAASGETLRRWCEIYETYKNMIGLEQMKPLLSFNHFERAKWLANHSERVSVPAYALATAISLRLTADEMVKHFNGNHNGTHPYEKAIGALDVLQAVKYEWLTRDDRETVIRDLSEVREILERKAEQVTG